LHVPREINLFFLIYVLEKSFDESRVLKTWFKMFTRMGGVAIGGEYSLI